MIVWTDTTSNCNKVSAGGCDWGQKYKGGDTIKIMYENKSLYQESSPTKIYWCHRNVQIKWKIKKVKNKSECFLRSLK